VKWDYGEGDPRTTAYWLRCDLSDVHSVLGALTDDNEHHLDKEQLLHSARKKADLAMQDLGKLIGQLDDLYGKRTR
jgi:hypothetical protein